jgi:hypothetical protein
MHFGGFPLGYDGVEDAEVVRRLCQQLWKNPDPVE